MLNVLAMASPMLSAMSEQTIHVPINMAIL